MQRLSDAGLKYRVSAQGNADDVSRGSRLKRHLTARIADNDRRTALFEKRACSLIVVDAPIDQADGIAPVGFAELDRLEEAWHAGRRAHRHSERYLPVAR